MSSAKRTVDEAPSRRPATAGRLSSLDGLRGFAALIVVAHHTLLTFSFYSQAYIYPTRVPAKGTVQWWLTATPLHLISEGTEAVLVFFVLSGLVVALPVLRRSTFDWYAYFPRRIIRLVLPVMAAALLAAVFVLVSNQQPAPGPPTWLSLYSIPHLQWTQVVSALDPLSGDGMLNNPVWSLHWEIIFSLALPAYIVLAVAVKRFWVVALIAVTFVSWLGTQTANSGYLYLGVFLLGTIIAVRLDDLSALADRLALRRFSPLIGIGALIGSLLLLSVRWMIWGSNPGDAIGTSIGGALAVPGAAGLVLIAAFWNPARVFLTTKVLHWLGRVSFSLYLVHVPIIIATRSLLHTHTVLFVIVAIVASLLVAELFTRFVELPSHRLAKRVGRIGSEKMHAILPRPDGSN